MRPSAGDDAPSARDQAPAASDPGQSPERLDDEGASVIDEGRRPPANAPRPLRGGLTALAALLVALFVVSVDVRLGAVGVLIGGVAYLVASWGLLDLIGSFDDEVVVASVELSSLARPAFSTLAAFAAFAFSLAGAARGSLGPAAAGLLVTGSFVALVAAAFALARAIASPSPAAGRSARTLARTLARRHGFWLVVAAAVLYWPAAGAYSLIDPWETHYGEVSREILARGDWVSLWWAQGGWFWSKPVLDFWLQALSMLALGVDYRPDHVLAPDAAGVFPHPEWAARAPTVLVATLAAYLLYKGAASAVGRRAAFFGALVLLTAPQWALLAHQSMTDMPFVGALTAAMGLVLWGIHTDPARVAPVYELRAGAARVRVSAFHLVALATLLVALPQVVYLVGRHLDIVSIGGIPRALRWHADRFWAGSPGNCGLPGNDAFRACRAFRATLDFPPWAQAALWSSLIGVFLWLNAGERRVRRLCFLGAYLCAALSMLAKGPAGVLLPALCIFVYIAVTGRWRLLADLEITSGTLLVSAVALPWFVAAFARHGMPFLDQLFFHDMWKRALVHVHDANEGEDVSFRYYLGQLGYALFPWVGLAPTALVWWARRADDEREPPANDVSVFLIIWFTFAFALFTAMLTKFHHYIFPALPPAALLVGILLDRLAERRLADDPPLAASLVAGAGFVALVGADLLARPANEAPGAARLLFLFSYLYQRPWPAALDFRPALAAFTLTAAAATLALAFARARRVALALLGAVAFAFSAWCLDVYLVRLAPHWGQREIFETYYRSRTGPGEPIAAYQMNWKGENFYTGNHLAAFVSGNPPLAPWLRARRADGTRTFFFVTPYASVDTLVAELADPSSFERLTDASLNNKFLLVRARFE